MLLRPPDHHSPLVAGEERVVASQRPSPRGFRDPRRLLRLVAAGLFFTLAMLGAILPGLPTTPFLLLTSYFLAKSSPRLHRALLNSRFFGPILVDWQVHRGVRRHIKVKAMVAVTAAVCMSVYFAGYALAPTTLIAALAAVGVVVIWRLPTATANR